MLGFRKGLGSKLRPAPVDHPRQRRESVAVDELPAMAERLGPQEREVVILAEEVRGAVGSRSRARRGDPPQDLRRVPEIFHALPKLVEVLGAGVTPRGYGGATTAPVDAPQARREGSEVVVGEGPRGEAGARGLERSDRRAENCVVGHELLLRLTVLGLEPDAQRLQGLVGQLVDESFRHRVEGLQRHVAVPSDGQPATDVAESGQLVAIGTGIEIASDQPQHGTEPLERLARFVDGRLAIATTAQCGERDVDLSAGDSSDAVGNGLVGAQPECPGGPLFAAPTIEERLTGGRGRSDRGHTGSSDRSLLKRGVASVATTDEFLSDQI